jgi:hypothetical protein
MINVSPGNGDPFRGSTDWLDTVTVGRGKGLKDYDTTNEEWGL